MLYLSIFFKSIAVGLSIASPPGPSSLMCIQTTIEEGWSGAKMVLVGAAAAHLFYTILAASGIMAMYSFAPGYIIYFKIMATSILCYFALQAWWQLYSNKSLDNVSANSSGHALQKAFFVFLFTLSNPMTIVGFMSFFTAFGIQPNSFFEGLLVIIGTGLGSTFWRLFLVHTTNLLRERILYQYIPFLRCSCACMLTLFAGFAIYGTII